MTRNILWLAGLAGCVLTLPVENSLHGAQDDLPLPTRITPVSDGFRNTAEEARIRGIFADENVDQVEGLEAFLSDNPASAWAPSVHAALADIYRSRGRNTLAINQWTAAWERLKTA